MANDLLLGVPGLDRTIAARTYAKRRILNARKSYQIYAMFLPYLSQPALLGLPTASAMLTYRTFDSRRVLFGRGMRNY